MSHLTNLSSSNQFYYATSQKSTAVTHSLVGEITAPKELNLVLGKTSRIEIYRITNEGLSPLCDIGINGRIGTMNIIRIAPEKKDYIVITTERYQMIILTYDSGQKSLRTVAAGDLRDRVGRRSQKGQLAVMDPSAKTMTLLFYDGLLKIIPTERGFAKDKTFNVRIDEQDVLDMVYLHTSTAVPTLALLYRDNNDNVHIRSYTISLTDRNVTDGPITIPSTQLANQGTNDAYMALVTVPLPLGGLLIIGRKSILYYTNREFEVLTLPSPKLFRAHCMIDANRYLFADATGSLYLLVLNAAGSTTANPKASTTSANTTSANVSLEWSRLGTTVIASTLKYVDAGVVYVGSSSGDPQIIRLKQHQDPVTGAFFDVLGSHINLGPIVDFAVLDLDRQGQCAVVTCSGVGKEGSLRVVRNGVGIQEQAVVELPGIRGLWSLRSQSSSVYDKYLVQTYSSETRVFTIEGDDMNEAELNGLRTDVTSLYCGTMQNDTLVQVLATEVRLVSGDGNTLRDTWKPEQGSRITVANGNDKQILLALSGGNLVLLNLDTVSLTFQQTAATRMPHEISCLNIHNLYTNGENDTTVSNDSSMNTDSTLSSSSSSSSLSSLSSSALSSSSSSLSTAVPTYAAVGLWTDISLRIIELPSLKQVAEVHLGGDIPARSVLLANLEGTHVFVGMGDGHLFSFRIDKFTGQLTERKKIALGRSPITLTPFRNRGNIHVFAACDRPTVLFSMSKKLVFSNVNLGEVRVMAPFHSESFPDCLALAMPNTLAIGTVDEIQRLHVKTVPLNAQPRRITHHKASHSLIVALETVRRASNPVHNTVYGEEVGVLQLVDDASYDVLTGTSFELDPTEICMSIATVPLSSDNNNSTESITYVAVGTAYVIEDEEEPSHGRILILAIQGTEQNRQIQLVTQKEVRGGVFAVASLAGNKLVVSVNSKIQVYKWFTPLPSIGTSTPGTDDQENTMDTSSGTNTINYSLVPECGYHGHILGLQLDTRGDFILVGDLMKSISLLRYNAANSTLEEVAAEPSNMWMTAAAMVEDTVFVGGERHYNVFTAVRNVTATTEEERLRLDITGEFHIGDLVNRIRQGSLVMLPTDAEDNVSSSSSNLNEAEITMSDVPDSNDSSSNSNVSMSASGTKRARMQDNTSSVTNSNTSLLGGPRPRLIMGTVSGALGVLISLPTPLYTYLTRVQQAINRVVHGVGGLSHNSYRAFYRGEGGALPSLFPGAPEPRAKGYVDGDMLETFLDLETELQNKVIDLLNGIAPSTASSSSGGNPNNALKALFPSGTVKHPDGSSDGLASLEELTRVIEDLSRLH